MNASRTFSQRAVTCPSISPKMALWCLSVWRTTPGASIEPVTIATPPRICEAPKAAVRRSLESTPFCSRITTVPLPIKGGLLAFQHPRASRRTAQGQRDRSRRRRPLPGLGGQLSRRGHLPWRSVRVSSSPEIILLMPTPSDRCRVLDRPESADRCPSDRYCRSWRRLYRESDEVPFCASHAVADMIWPDWQ